MVGALAHIGLEVMELPERIQLNGRWYVAEDAVIVPSKPPEHEPYEPLRRLCKEYEVDPHRAYDAIKAGRLDARKPNGAKRGYRARHSEFVRWVEEDLMGRRDGLAG